MRELMVENFKDQQMAALPGQNYLTAQILMQAE